MFPVSLNPYFNPTLSFSQPFTNPEWAMRAYAHHAWDPFQAQAYYRGGYPNSIYEDGKIQHKAHNDDLVDRLEKLVRAKLAARKAEKDSAKIES